MKVKVLLIDDNEDNLISFKALINLIFPEAVVLTANNGNHGISLAVSEDPDVILLDIFMPDLDGFQVCTEIKANHKTTIIPVVFVTALNNDNSLRIKAANAGADGFLTKPVDETELLVQIKAMVRVKDAGKKLMLEQEHLNEMVNQRTAELKDSHEQMKQMVDELNLTIEEHKKTLTELQQSEEKFRKLFENHSAVKLLIDPESGKISDANLSAAEFYGWSREELKQMNISQINMLDKEDVKKLLAIASEHQRNYFEFKHKISNEEIRDVAVYSTGIEINGKPILHSIIHDISEQHRIHDALKTNENRLKRAELASKSGNWELHIETNTMFSSVGANKIYGVDDYTKQLNFYKEIPLPEYRQLLDEALKNLIENDKPYIIDFKIRAYNSGEIKDIHSEAFFDREKKIVFGIIQDVTARKKTEDKLKESEEKYRLMFETALEGILVAQNYEIVYFNPVIPIITGYNSDELQNMPFLNLIHPDDQELVISNYKNRLEEKAADQNYEFRIIRKNGEIRWVLLTGAKLNWNGEPATFNFINDVTDRKLAEISLIASKEKYRLITENTSDVIWILNLKQMKFTYISPSIFQLRGYTVEEAMNQTIEESLTPASAELVNERVKKALPLFLADKNHEASRSLTQIQQPCKDGRVIWVEVATQFQLNHAGEIEVLGVSRNIEERKKMEDELRRSEVELRELIATKDKFFSIIAHDLKSPFNGIAGFSDLLKSDARLLDIDEIIQYAGLINTSAKNTMTLLENLLDWAQVQRGQMLFNPKPALIGELLKDALELVRQVAVQKGIAIESSVSDDLIFNVDENMFKLLIRNLVGNAVKFSHSGSNIEVFVESSDSNIRISVKDNGIGISSENIEKLFSIRTGYVVRGTANEKGTGLGLILCREFVEKHGGRIWCESKLGEGSTFIFELPLKNN